ncbi:MAG: dihydroorotate dehydrogenase-like protein [Anaerolineae bacterium]|nr:dihydroorotate dehydrogenase-like protein [Anaerolineae bacterium]
MADLSTTFMGLQLKNPIVPSASPLSRELVRIKQMAEAGAGAIILYSLFEEQIEGDTTMLDDVVDNSEYQYAEFIDFFPERSEFRRNEEGYLALIREAKAAVDIPIIASLNGFNEGDWTHHAREFERAGADAIELNIYYLPTSAYLTGAQVESLYLAILNEVKKHVTIPVAVKLSPFFSSIPHFAKTLEDAGADGLVLFNRFYQPDLDIEALNVTRHMTLSTPNEIRVPLHWVAILHGRVRCSLALNTGVHTTEDIVKSLMVGADVVNVCSVLLRDGIGSITELRDGLNTWLDDHQYASVAAIQGILSLKSCPSPAAFERANYVQLLQA